MTNGLKLFWPTEIEGILAGLDQAARGRCAEYHAALEDVATALGIRGPTASIYLPAARTEAESTDRQ